MQHLPHWGDNNRTEDNIWPLRCNDQRIVSLNWMRRAFHWRFPIWFFTIWGSTGTLVITSSHCPFLLQRFNWTHPDSSETAPLRSLSEQSLNALDRKHSLMEQMEANIHLHFHCWFSIHLDHLFDGNLTDIWHILEYNTNILFCIRYFRFNIHLSVYILILFILWTWKVWPPSWISKIVIPLW